MLGLSSTALAVTKSVVNAVVATLTIAFLTLFMLLEGPNWVERLYSLLPETSQPRWRRVGREIYRTVGGYVTGNLAISFIAGSHLDDRPPRPRRAVRRRARAARRDPRPDPARRRDDRRDHRLDRRLPRLLDRGDRPDRLLLLYQQFENHVLQPLVYGRTVQLSPLIVLIAVLMGAKLAGVIGALGAIPIAGSLQVVILDWLAHRRQRLLEPSTPTGTTGLPP